MSVFEFGNHPTGVPTDWASNTNFIRGTKFVCSQNGFAQSITAYLLNTASGYPARCAIYRVSDMALIAASHELPGPSPDGWITFPIDGSPALVAGIEYLLVLWGTMQSLARDGASTNIAYGYPLTYTGTFPNPLPNIPANWNNKTDWIYCTATTTAAATYNLTIQAGPNGTTDPAPATYGPYNTGQTQIITALPNADYQLDHFEDPPGTNVGQGVVLRYTVTFASSNRTVLVVFAPIPPTQHTLTVNSTPITNVPFTLA